MRLAPGDTLHSAPAAQEGPLFVTIRIPALSATILVGLAGFAQAPARTTSVVVRRRLIGELR